MPAATLPRLTTALRVFSGLSDSRASEEVDDLSAKRKFNANKLREKQTLSWNSLCSTVQDARKDDLDDAKKALRELLQYAKQIAGPESSSDIIESGAAFLFETLRSSEMITHAETAKLRTMFGPFPASTASKACAVTHKLANWIPEKVLGKLCVSSTSSESDEPMFGENIKFVPPKYLVDYDEFPDSDTDEAANDGFDLRYNDGSQTNSKETGSGVEKKDSNWLRAELNVYFPDLGDAILDLCTSIFEILKSSRTDEELQNELFELLGFDRFELIMKLLENRQQVVKETFVSASQVRVPKGRQSDLSQRPNYGCQVTIQSKQEQLLRKQFRKEDKKIGKKNQSAEEEAYMQAIGFNPEQMRAHREAALLTAANAPLFSRGGGREAYTRERFPFVFDMYAEAKQASAFVSGAKMLLPEGSERRSDKFKEEVTVPHTQGAPVDVGHKLVSISSLDEISQIAFKGTKSLNRIQSVVFETAFKTNENLLISAPTGAGKTNIAMLTILHELKQHLSQGVIKKDEFKIIYVAPMKALAAEMVRNFGGRLEPLGILVKELTGDMQLTKQEILKTQMLVTTPEKWDVVTRKSTGDVALTQLVKLLIIDEVHLLHEDRGSVIESLVARTLRQVESSQSMIRIVGLSATLPNYLDVARFLHVNPYLGLFFFDGRFRPVPLGQTFIGVKTPNRIQQIHDMNKICYEKVLHEVKRGEQVMVFVHARNETVRTAMSLRELAKNEGDSMLFQAEPSSFYGDALKQMARSRNKPLRELFPDGFATHHAGMLRQDRNLVEKFFAAGYIKCLVCTATLAWGVNLPAHAVIIKGTQIYDAKHGAFVDLGILDVMQIFGRAGRPQFDKYGHGTIITTHDKLSHYLSLMTRQNPIESQFINSMTDNLNAEVALGTVTNVEEAVRWLSYTYLFVRMRCNPLVYGVNYAALQDDPTLEVHRRDLIVSAARKLDKAAMVRFDERTGYLHATDLGRTASHFYIKYDTVEVINELLKPLMNDCDVLGMVSQSTEFEQIKVREEELQELDDHLLDSCPMPAPGGTENTYGKVNILLQTYVSRANVESFSLVSDMAYTAQNSARILRALFEIVLRKGWPIMAGRLLTLSKVVDKRLWAFENPLRQFATLSPEILGKIERHKLTVSRLKEMEANEIGHLIHHVRMGGRVKECVNQIPDLELEATIQPITRTVLRVSLTITAQFLWNDRVHGKTSESFWIWVEDPDNNHMYHSEYFMLTKKSVVNQEPQHLVFTIPIFEPLPTQYYVRAESDRWLGASSMCAISFQHLILPERHPPHTDLLDLEPLPKSALDDPQLEALYSFTHFNPIQTQIFHTLYHTDSNVLLGAPTGSGKTVAAEMAIFRVFREQPKAKAVYIAPLKALVRERIEDWKKRLEEKLGKRVVELTGDVTPDMRAVASADLIVTTPEKWDGISRSWQTRGYVQAVALLVIDEIHLLGADRGPVLEVVVSRTNFISSHTGVQVRVVGLSTALANARDLADWLGIKQMGLFNFRPSVRPVPLEVHINGFPGKHYCPRMATMNKPTFQAIRTHSPAKPALVFVSSRRQTRLTALDLIAFLAAEDNPKQWLHNPEIEMENIIAGIHDANLKLTLAFGIGIHHAGLHERDRKTVEELFVNSKIQVLVATSTLAWGVNFPAHLVVVKGTEYFDGKLCRYVDFPITDVLQMMGRAGRPQFDDQGVAVILVHDIKKHFYKKFLYEPFPVESSLLGVLPDHMNAEIVAGTIKSKQDAMDYITWTYFFRRLVMNPSFYKLESTDHQSINLFLSSLVENALLELESSYCIEIEEDNRTINTSTLGRISSYYYLSHETVRMFRDELESDSSMTKLIEILANADEYSELPVRHNEDQINSDLAQRIPFEVNQYAYDDSHTKAHILLQAHYSRLQLPSSDYLTDTKSVMDQAIRICQALLDVSADSGWLVTALRIINIIQMTIQGRWWYDNTLLTLPHIQPFHLQSFRSMDCLPEVMAACRQTKDVARCLGDDLSPNQIDQIYKVLIQLPVTDVSMSVKGWWDDGSDREQVRHLHTDMNRGVRPDSNWLRVHADQEYVLNINLVRVNKHKKKDSKAYAPNFPKPKDEGWFLVLGDIENQELMALKRVGYVHGQSSQQLAFYTPEETGRVIYTLYLMSDSYLGLDQQYDICLDVVPPSIEAQVNTELKGELDELSFEE